MGLGGPESHTYILAGFACGRAAECAQQGYCCVTWLLAASVTSGHGDNALLSWVDQILGNLGLLLLVGLGSTGTVRCRQTCPVLAKFDRKANHTISLNDICNLYACYLSCILLY